MPITIPPLAERPEDVLPLAAHFLARLSRSMNLRELSFAPDALAALARARLARQRARAAERDRARGRPREAARHPRDGPSDPGRPRGRPRPPAGTSAAAAVPAGVRSLADLEKVHIGRVLEETGWNVSQAASVLDVDRGTLYNKIKKYDLAKPAGTA